MATHSSILAWRSPQIEGPGMAWSLGCKEWDTTEQLILLLYYTKIAYILQTNIETANFAEILDSEI